MYEEGIASAIYAPVVPSVETLHHHGTTDVSRGPASAKMVTARVQRLSDAGLALIR